LAKIKGARVLMFDEFDESKPLSTKRIKELSSGNRPL
jgi:hypothetical protein